MQPAIAQQLEEKRLEHHSSWYAFHWKSAEASSLRIALLGCSCAAGRAFRAQSGVAETILPQTNEAAVQAGSGDEFRILSERCSSLEGKNVLLREQTVRLVDLSDRTRDENARLSHAVTTT